MSGVLKKVLQSIWMLVLQSIKYSVKTVYVTTVCDILVVALEANALSKTIGLKYISLVCLIDGRENPFKNQGIRMP